MDDDQFPHGPMSIADAMKYQKKMGKKGKRSKYKNVRTEYNGRMYASKHEARCSQQLDQLRKATKKDEKVLNVAYQVRYPIRVNGVKICDYIADFVVKWGDGRTEVIDAKGVMTDVYKLKKKLMKVCNDIEIIEW